MAGKISQASPCAGFTLLEAIVALTIMGLALVPMITFVAQAANQLERAADANDRSFAKQTAIALLDPVNPMEEPQGTLPVDKNLTVSWDTKELVAPDSELLIGSGLAQFHVGFYHVHVSLTRQDTGQWFEFDMRKAGYQKVPSSLFGPGTDGPQ